MGINLKNIYFLKKLYVINWAFSSMITDFAHSLAWFMRLGQEKVNMLCFKNQNLYEMKNVYETWGEEMQNL